MPSEVLAIEVDRLSKAYRKGVSRSTRLTERRGRDHPDKQEFWALEDVSFGVEPGQVLGIIGRNGAGKSTLLKILARITPPTSGEARIRGRVASLLEVGTGFHQELTGRENVLLSAAILGMSRKQIQSRMDEIIEFSRIGDFIDTPVKRYSTGMYVRLGFAVAAHIDADVLLVDEVLAVGDAEFRKRCLGRIDDITKSGRTVLLVSHDMGTVTQLADRAILMGGGQILHRGPPEEAVDRYLRQFTSNTSAIEFEENLEAAADFRSAAIRTSGSKATGKLSCDDEIIVEVVAQIRKVTPDLYAAFYLRKGDGSVALFSDSRDRTPEQWHDLQPGLHMFQVPVPPRTLAPGRYTLTVGLSSASSGSITNRPDVCEIELHDLTSIRGDARPGAVGTLLEWNHVDARAG